IILKTGGKGPAMGFLIYGRFIDEAEISKFNKMTALNLGFNRILDGRLDESQKAAAASDSLKYSLHKSLSEETITCHLIFNDFNDKPLFIVNFKEPRTIYGQAVIALRYFSAALLIAGLIFFVMTSYLIDKFIADRIIKLSSEVKKLSVEGNYQKRLSFKGKDEIASLSSEINGLLDNIEDSNREMKKLVNDLDIATRAKSDFIGSIGHELRTPITCIIGYTDILEDTMPEGESREFVNRIKLSSHVLISTVNDILDYTSIEGGDLKLNFSEFKMSDVFKEINEYAGFIAAEKKLSFSSTIDDKLLQARVLGDETRLKQIVLNLAGNALKFTNDGFIELGAQLVSDSGDEVEIKINIKDSGIGIDEQTQQRIFMPFVQGDSSSTRKYGGAGLGLSIADRLVRLMGGERIKLESKPGEGSNFHFNIKLKKA
ncbi:MAG TPA: ATP-binding protein, partial [Candidatus Wallbacteria bacterium]|nr:ATP-binding protein [Candidatus Wallbacteria bacterium]